MLEFKRTVRSIAEHYAHAIPFARLEKPEILPFSPRPKLELEKYKRDWEAHVQEFETLL